MTMMAQHLSIDELEARVRGCSDAVERSHCQAIWLLAKGHSTAEVAEVVALTPRWINKLARRYERTGAVALGDQRRRNPGGKPLLSAADLAALRERLRRPPDDGGLLDGTEGGALDCRAAGARPCSRPTRLGSAEEARLVDPGATAEEPEIGDARRGRSF